MQIPTNMQIQMQLQIQIKKQTQYKIHTEPQLQMRTLAAMIPLIMALDIMPAPMNPSLGLVAGMVLFWPVGVISSPSQQLSTDANTKNKKTKRKSGTCMAVLVKPRKDYDTFVSKCRPRSLQATARREVDFSSSYLEDGS